MHNNMACIFFVWLPFLSLIFLRFTNAVAYISKYSWIVFRLWTYYNFSCRWTYELFLSIMNKLCVLKFIFVWFLISGAPKPEAGALPNNSSHQVPPPQRTFLYIVILSSNFSLIKELRTLVLWLFLWITAVNHLHKVTDSIFWFLQK